MPTLSMLRANSWVSSDSGEKPDSDGAGAVLVFGALALFEDIAETFVKSLITRPQAAPKRHACRQISQSLALFTRSFAGAGALVAVYRTGQFDARAAVRGRGHHCEVQGQIKAELA
jgi:hypothetical protein